MASLPRPSPGASRRDFLTGVACLGAATLLPGAPDTHGRPDAISPASPAPTASASPVLTAAEREEASARLLAYFGQTAPLLLRPAAGALSRPNIACSLPGKAYSSTLWDWDTYWTLRGLFRYAALSRDTAFREKLAEHAVGSVLTFFDYQSDEGRIPMLLTVKNPDPLGTLLPDRPRAQNQAKPVFAQMALLVADELGSTDWFARHFEKLLRFHASWVAGNRSATGLFVWGNDVAIGNDNDPTTFGRPDFSSANLLLNSLFYEEFQAAAELARRLRRPDDAARLDAQARALGESIQTHCWDPRDQFYYTADVQCVDRRRELIPAVKPGMDTSWRSLPLRIQTFTGFLPLWCGLATPAQASSVVEKHYLADDRFRSYGGVRTLSSRETMYSLEYSKGNPSNWLGPVWIIANYFVWKGLQRSGFAAEAGEMADKTMRLLAADLAASGSLNEYYHPDTAASISHKGFMNWNLLVLEMM